MSSMRNAVQRRSHKERAQPKEREKWGILEKHKDYSLRASDYNEKKRRLKILRQKAAERNPDEFHFAMMNSTTEVDGKKSWSRGNTALSSETIKLLKTQDAGYLRTVAQHTKKSRERLEESVAIQLRVNKKSGLYRAASTNSDSLRTTFVTPTPGQHNYPKLQQQEHTQSSVMGRSADDATGITNQGRAHRNTAVHHEADAPYNDEAISSLHPKERRAIREKRNRDLATRQSRLKALKEQELELSAAERELDAQRQRISESWGHQRNSAGVRFKLRERKK